MIRRSFAELPGEPRRLIEVHCGEVLRESSAPAGRHSELSATLTVSGGDTVGPGRVFAKGITVGMRGAADHRHEVRLNTVLPHVAPRLLWTVEADGWLVLGYEHVEGHHADLTPGSSDLAHVAEALDVLATTLTPCPRDDVGVLSAQWAKLAAWRRLRANPPEDLHPWVRDNLDMLAEWEPRAIGAVTGNSLAHTDLHALNILVGTTAYVVDWAWARRAPAWVDAAFLVLRLIEAGHEPAEAERWADRFLPASGAARTAFAVEVLGIWEFLQRHKPLPHRPRLTGAARAWARDRLSLRRGVRQ